MFGISESNRVYIGIVFLFVLGLFRILGFWVDIFGKCDEEQGVSLGNVTRSKAFP